MVILAALAVAAAASAQTSGSAPAGRRQQPSAQSSDVIGQTAQKPAAAGVEQRRYPSGDDDVHGDTGLWFVPTGEVLPAKTWSVSAYRVNFDDNQGFTDVSNWPVTFGLRRSGIGPRLFGSWTLVRRIDRDIRPLFVPTNPLAGGVVTENPFVRAGLVGNKLGDFWLGAKVNLHVAVAAAAGGVRAARHGEAADGERRRRGVGHRQARIS